MQTQYVQSHKTRYNTRPLQNDEATAYPGLVHMEVGLERECMKVELLTLIEISGRIHKDPHHSTCKQVVHT